MIIEIKDIPNEQIDKIDIHIDFKKQTYSVCAGKPGNAERSEKPFWKSNDVQVAPLKDAPKIPDEMLNGDF